MTALSTRFREALTWAAELHATQVRKSTSVPYVSHLLAVAALALEHGADEDEAIAALLHDAPEDQGGQAILDEIRRRFGPRVMGIVEGCTDTLASCKPPWRARKEAYVAHAARADASTALVCACDKLHNARCTLADVRVAGDAAFEKFSGGKAGTLWYYRALASALRGKAPAALAGELDRVVSELERMAGVISPTT
jgi:(p)ppGpp synthase/HD superfamily hydrolase